MSLKKNPTINHSINSTAHCLIFHHLLNPYITIEKSNSAPSRDNELCLMYNGSTDFDEFIRSMDRESVREWVHYQFLGKAEGVEADVEGFEYEEEWMDPWVPLVHNHG